MLPLFAFNVGLEVGQVLIVIVLFLLGTLMTQIVKMSRRDWLLVVSGATAGVAITLILDRIPG